MAKRLNESEQEYDAVLMRTFLLRLRDADGQEYTATGYLDAKVESDDGEKVPLISLRQPIAIELKVVTG